MCIICVKNSKVEDFSTDILKYCWDKNSDGAGYAYWNDKKQLWSVRKGFMKYGDFIKDYQANKFKVNDTVFVHFRIGTSGYKDGGNTHPFPVLDDVDKMRETEFDSPYIAIHNGVVGQGEKVASDTICYIRDYIFPLMSIWEDKRVHENIAPAILTKGASRWIITYGSTFWEFGTWHSHNGWRFSNTNYEASIPTYYRSTTQYGFTNNTPFISDANLDSFYELLKRHKKLPDGYYASGVSLDKKGYWQGGRHYSWEERWNLFKDKIEERGSLPPESKIKAKESYFNIIINRTAAEFDEKYFSTYCTRAGKCLTVFNWKVYSIDMNVVKVFTLKQAAKENVVEKEVEQTPVIMDSTGETLVFEDPEHEKDQEQTLNDLKMCPHCYDEVIAPSPYTLGDCMCKTCGCVFTLSTGTIHLYDFDTYKVYKDKKMKDESKSVTLYDPDGGIHGAIF